jgi:D-glycero-alpha-D-manno-heptose-7-phosphate kinase
MIVSKSPLRISLFGGGTDIKSFYSKFGSRFISLAIDKYVYSLIHEPFEEQFFLKYRKNEIVKDIELIKNELLKDILIKLNLKKPLEISNFADIPFGTGLGSSGAYIVSMVNALNSYPDKSYKNSSSYKKLLALNSSKIETNFFNNNIVGLQDTYISTYGGLKSFAISKSGNVAVKDLVSKSDVKKFSEQLFLFFTNKVRRTNNQKSKLSKKEHEANLHKVLQMEKMGKEYLLAMDSESIGRLLYEQWLLKLKRNPSPFHKKIDEIIEDSIKFGAYGGKLIGAGGGGFILIHSNKKHITKINEIMIKNNFKHVKFEPDFDGATKLII